MKKQNNTGIIIVGILMLSVLLTAFYYKKQYEVSVKEKQELKTDYLSKVDYSNYIEKKYDSLKKVVNERKPTIVVVKEKSKKSNSRADSSKIVFKNDSNLSNCTVALDDCTKARIDLDIENNVLTQQNSDLTELHEIDSVTVDAYITALNHSQKQRVLLEQKVAKLPKIKNFQPFVIVGSDVKFTTQKVQVGVDVYRKVLIGASGSRFYGDFSYTLDFGFKF